MKSLKGQNKHFELQGRLRTNVARVTAAVLEAHITICATAFCTRLSTLAYPVRRHQG